MLEIHLRLTAERSGDKTARLVLGVARVFTHRDGMSDVIEPAGFRPPPQRVPVRADQRHITLVCPECSKRGVHVDVWSVFRSAKLSCRACLAVTNPWYEQRRWA